MRKLHEYEKHARECRAMARASPPAHRNQLTEMAQTWEQLAEARKKQLAKEGKSREDDAPTDH